MTRFVGSVLGVGLLCLAALPVEAEEHPTYQTLWDEASHDPGCSASEHADFILVDCIANLTLSYFTKPDHPAHPGVIKRTLIRQADGTWVSHLQGSSFGTDAMQPAFKAWLAQIEDLDRQMMESIKKQHGVQPTDTQN